MKFSSKNLFVIFTFTTLVFAAGSKTLLATSNCPLAKASAQQTSDAQEPAAAQNDKKYIEDAAKIIAEFGKSMKDFFNKSNKDSLKTHLAKIAKIIGSISSLVTIIESKFKVNKSTKLEAFAKVLRNFQKRLIDVHAGLATGNTLNGIKAFKNSLSKASVNGLKNEFDQAKELGTENEKKLLDAITQEIDSTLNSIPSSDFTCAAIIATVMKRA